MLTGLKNGLRPRTVPPKSEACRPALNFAKSAQRASKAALSAATASVSLAFPKA